MVASMHVYKGRSHQTDPSAAVSEAVAGVPNALVPSIVIAFTSVKQDKDGVVAALSQRFPGTVIVGCTTAGEIFDGVRTTDSLVVSALDTPAVRWDAVLLKDLRGAPDVEGVVTGLCERLGCDRADYEPGTYFAMLLIDGMSGKEEVITTALADALCGIPLIGGAAADGLAFRQTHVFANGEVATDAAVIILAHAPQGADLVKHQHYFTMPRYLAVTSAVPAERRVNQFDGRPAAEAYAALVGVDRAEIVGDVNPITFTNPVLFACGGDVYVRSVRRVDEDGAMHFHSAIEEGMVLEIGGRADMVDAMRIAVDEHLAKHGKADLFIGFNCILRALEMEQSGASQGLAEQWQRVASQSIGFDTYGEVWNGIHVNHTLIGVALRDPSRTKASDS